MSNAEAQPTGTFDPERFKLRVRDKTQRAIGPHLGADEAVRAIVPGLSAGPERRKRGLLPRSRHRMVVATNQNVYVFAYRFGRIRELELKEELGNLPVRVHDTDQGGGYMTVGDLSLRIGPSVWRNWRAEARQISDMNFGGAPPR